MTDDHVPSMSSPTPEEILFTDSQGQPAQVEDIIEDGIEGGYDDRIPALLRLLEQGNPYHRLLACVVLTSWGHERGFQQLVQWARDPAHVPWAMEPVTFDRFSSADASFEQLAQAVLNSYFSREAASIRPLQIEATEALLGIADRRFLGRTLALTIASDAEVNGAVASRVRAAIETIIVDIHAGRFDPYFQAASLLSALAPVDDAAAARLAGELIRIAPRHERMLRELTTALASGHGTNTLEVLQRMRSLGFDTVTEDVDAALARRSS